MHELLLYGQLPGARHEQLLNVLAGVTAMQPQRVIERHVLFKPTRVPVQNVLVRGGAVQEPKGLKKKGQQIQQAGDLYFVKLVKEVDEDEFGDGDVEMDSDGNDEEGKKIWKMRFEDVPEPGKRSATLRMAENTDLADGDAQAFMEALGYKLLSDFIVEGHRFVSGNIVLFLHRVLYHPSSRNQQIGASINTPLPPLSEFEPLDQSGGYLLQALVRLSDGTNPTIVNLGLKVLDDFRLRMKGVIDMKMPDRLSMDTRVK